MVGVAADVPARGAVNGPAAVDLVKIAIAARFQSLGLVVADAPALVFDNERPFRDLLGRKQAKSCARSPDPKWLFPWHSKATYRQIRAGRTAALRMHAERGNAGAPIPIMIHARTEQ